MNILSDNTFLELYNTCCGQKTDCAIMFPSRSDADKFLRQKSTERRHEGKWMEIERFVLNHGFYFENGSRIKLLSPSNHLVGRRYRHILMDSEYFRPETFEPGTMARLISMERPAEPPKPDDSLWEFVVFDEDHGSIAYGRGLNRDLGELEASADISALFGQ